MRVRGGRLALVIAAWLALQNTGVQAGQSGDRLQQTVRDRETAFARTMADRDLNAFSTFLSTEAVFFGRNTLRGRQQVADGWKASSTVLRRRSRGGPRRSKC